MCGRIFIKPSATLEELLASFGIYGDLPQLNNLAPTEAVPVLRESNEGFALTPMRWWLHPSWSKDEPNQKMAMFNARIETVQTSPAFRGAVKYRRGIIPAAAFVEWKTEGKVKHPFYIEAVGAPLALATIWENWQDKLLSCAVITQPANKDFESIHTRMPLSLVGDQINYWLDHKNPAGEVLHNLNGASATLHATPVSQEINNARFKGEVTFI